MNLERGKGGGSSEPHWRSDGKELCFMSLAVREMAAEVDTEKGFQSGTPRRLFSFPELLAQPDVAGDGKRFLFALSEEATAQTPFTIVLNWQALLKK
jgi:hypothetical protein